MFIIVRCMRTSLQCHSRCSLWWRHSLGVVKSTAKCEASFLQSVKVHAQTTKPSPPPPPTPSSVFCTRCYRVTPFCCMPHPVTTSTNDPAGSAALRYIASMVATVRAPTRPSHPPWPARSQQESPALAVPRRTDRYATSVPGRECRETVHSPSYW